MGVVPPQVAFDTQGTQVPVAVRQAGRGPVHREALLAEHWPQAPLGWQAGVAPPHWPSLEHGTQVCVAPSQMGVVPAQSAFVAQRTQVPLLVSQTGVAPVHRVEFPAEHWPQAPLG